MKKLMIAAAAAAMVGGAYAALPDDTAVIDGTGVGSVYNVALTMKTLDSKSYVDSKTKDGGCAICPIKGGKTYCAYLDAATIKISGVIAFCDCDTANGKAVFWYGSGKKATAFTTNLTDTCTAPASYEDLLDSADAGLTAMTVDRYGKTGNKSVVGIQLQNDVDILEVVGFGSYSAATYKYNKELDTFFLKTPAKFSASLTGSGTHFTAPAFEDDQGDLHYGALLPVDTVCTIAAEPCAADTNDTTPAFGIVTGSIKPGSASKKLSSVIPASIW